MYDCYIQYSLVERPVLIGILRTQTGRTGDQVTEDVDALLTVSPQHVSHITRTTISLILAIYA